MMAHDPLDIVRTRVAQIRTRHLIFVAVFVGISVLLWGISDAELPATGKVVIALALLGAALWQGSLSRNIGLGLRALESGTPRIVWVYPLRAFINGSEVARGVLIGLETGARHELPVSLNPTDITQVLEHLRTRLPHAKFGHDDATEARFQANPRSLT